MWDLPGPGLKPVAPALAGGFLTTEPPGKPTNVLIRRGDTDRRGEAQGRGHRKMAAEIRVMQPQAKECSGPPEAGGS